MESLMDLSIIIPVFNESNKIATDIQAASTFLVEQHLQGEIIISDDGSTDDTVQVAKATAVPSGVRLDVLAGNGHYGKGHAVRMGMLSACGDIVLFIDSGLCVPYTDLLQGMELIQSGQVQIVHGSRYLPDSIIEQTQPFFRRQGSVLFRKFISKLMGIQTPLTDTQCGLKMYEIQTARSLYGRNRIDGFMFDLEIILMAEKSGYGITEIPVRWTSDLDSRLSLARTPFGMIPELLNIKHMLRNL